MFELFVHEHLRRAGYRMRCEVPVRGYRVDFLACRDGQPAFYIEAKSPSERPEERLARIYRGEVLDLLNKHRAPGFIVMVELRGQPTRPVPMRQFELASRLRAWLRTLDQARALQERAANPAHAEEFRWPTRQEYSTHLPEVLLRIRAVPQTKVPPVAFNSFASTTSDGIAFLFRPDVPIADAIAEKAMRYGEFDRPYVIAVNVPEDAVSRSEILKGIHDGFAKGGRRAAANVSAVLLAHIPNVAAAVTLAPVLYVNPLARHTFEAHAPFFHPLQDHLRVLARRS